MRPAVLCRRPTSAIKKLASLPAGLEEEIKGAEEEKERQREADGVLHGIQEAILDVKCWCPFAQFTLPREIYNTSSLNLAPLGTCSIQAHNLEAEKAEQERAKLDNKAAKLVRTAVLIHCLL